VIIMDRDTARTNASDFLAQRRLSLDDVVALIGPVDPAHAVLLGGSVPEGLANAESDIDVMIIGDHRLEVAETIICDAASAAVTQKAGEGGKLATEVVQPRHLEGIATRMRATLEALDRPETAKQVYIFGEDDLRTLHRVRTGVRLCHEAAAAGWYERLGCARLPDYLTLLFIGFHFSHREDAIGEANAGHHASAIWMMRESLGYLAAAFLASLGETNPNNKWRLRLLERHRAELPRADEIFAFLLGTRPIASVDRAALKQLITLSDFLLVSVMQNRPAVVASLAQLHGQASFRTHLE
jgi:hypothetical protein